MNTADTEFDNTFVTIHNQEIDIHYRKKNLKLALDTVSKIYLSKKKLKYCSWIPGIKSLLDTDYNLCIRTRDNEEIRLEVKASERQFFIAPISVVRNRNKNRELTAAS